jgi:hypothetical protein
MSRSTRTDLSSSMISRTPTTSLCIMGVFYGHGELGHSVAPNISTRGNKTIQMMRGDGWIDLCIHNDESQNTPTILKAIRKYCLRHCLIF